MGSGFWVVGNGDEGRDPHHPTPITHDLLQIVPQLLRAARVAQLAERLRLDLADALSGDAELAANLFQRPLAPVVQAEAKLEYAPLAARQRVQDILNLLREQLVRGGVRRRHRALVLDE